MAGRFTQIYIHLVWTTKNREQWISPEIQDSLLQYFQVVCADLGCKLVAFGGMPDHVHLLIQLGTMYSIGEVVQGLKGGSAHRIAQEIALDPYFKWQRGYSAFSVNPDETDLVKRYILNQKAHHRDYTLVQKWEYSEE